MEINQGNNEFYVFARLLLWGDDIERMGFRNWYSICIEDMKYKKDGYSTHLRFNIRL